MPFAAKFPSTCGRCRSAIQVGRADHRHRRLGAQALGARHLPARARSTSGTAGQATVETTHAVAGLEVWTDGACSGNPGPGGWAWATKDGRQG